MDYISKLEKIVLGWAKNVPHLPVAAQKWLGANAWWIVVVGVIVNGIMLLISLGNLFQDIASLNDPSNSYYVTGNYTSVSILHIAVNIVFIAIIELLLALAIKPLQHTQKKGWVMLFAALIVSAIYIIVTAVLSLSVVIFIMDIIFGAIFLAIAAYFVFEIHGQFGHTTRRVEH